MAIRVKKLTVMHFLWKCHSTTAISISWGWAITVWYSKPWHCRNSTKATEPCGYCENDHRYTFCPPFNSYIFDRGCIHLFYRDGLAIRTGLHDCNLWMRDTWFWCSLVIRQMKWSTALLHLVALLGYHSHVSFCFVMPLLSESRLCVYLDLLSQTCVIIIRVVCER